MDYLVPFYISLQPFINIQFSFKFEQSWPTLWDIRVIQVSSINTRVYCNCTYSLILHFCLSGRNSGLTCDLDLANGNGAAPQQAQQPHQGGQVQGENPHQTGKLINSTEIGNEGKMFVGGLSKQTTTDSLKAYFEG